MTKIIHPVLLPLLFIGANAIAADSSYTEQFIRKQGWKPFERKPHAATPEADITPIMFYDRGNSAPSCGVLTRSEGIESSEFVELVGSDPGVGFPQCIDISSITSFKLLNKDYVAIEYLSRETRDDIDRGYHYLVREGGKPFRTDNALTEAVSVTPMVSSSPARKKVDADAGIRAARAIFIRNQFSEWKFVDRDFISDKFSSFSVLLDKKQRRCKFVVEAGDAPIAPEHDVFSPVSKCDAVLASSRYEVDGKIYYIAIFTTEKRKQLVAVLSADSDRKVKAEKTISQSINNSGSTKNMKVAKTRLATELR